MPQTSAEGTNARGDAPAYSQSIEGCLDTAISRHGLSQRVLARYLTRASHQVGQLQDNVRTGRLGLLNICRSREDVEEAKRALARLSDGARLIVFLGTGGSSLGGQTLAQLAGWNIPGGAPADQRRRPRTRFYDNLDGGTLSGALNDLDLGSTRFVVTSKSGGTAETLAQTIAALGAVRDAGLAARIPELFLGITEAAEDGMSNGLRRLFERFDIPMLDHHPGIGGRFSCLTNVGLLPAMARGLDGHAVRAGAQDVIDALMDATKAAEFAPALGAAMALAIAKEKGCGTFVFMPYADKLGRLASWYQQLWAESVGKNGQGTSPIAALGPLDQHSQLQLFMDGPRDHFITILRTPSAGTGPVIDAELAQLAGADYMAGVRVGDIVDAQARAVPEALKRAGRPVRTFDLPKLDERAIGAILMHFMLETIIAGRMLEIDPFNQPAVEDAKILTRERLSALKA